MSKSQPTALETLRARFGLREVHVDAQTRKPMEHAGKVEDALATVARTTRIAEEAMGLGRRVRLKLGPQNATFTGSTSKEADGTVTIFIAENTRAAATVVHEFAHALDITLEEQEAIGFGRPGIVALRECAAMRYDPAAAVAEVPARKKRGEDAEAIDYAEGGWLNDTTAMQATQYRTNALKGPEGAAEPAELLARSFEAWVADTIEQQHKTREDAARHLKELGLDRACAHENSIGYPQDAERETLHTLWGIALDAIEWTKEGPILRGPVMGRDTIEQWQAMEDALWGWMSAEAQKEIDAVRPETRTARRNGNNAGVQSARHRR